MNIRKILEGLNVNSNLINDIDSIINIDNYQNITKVSFNGKKLTIGFKVTNEIIEDESYIEIVFPHEELEVYIVRLSLCEYTSDYGQVKNEDARGFKIINKYDFDYDNNMGVIAYINQHILVELLDESNNEELYIFSQNNHDILIGSNYDNKTYLTSDFLAHQVPNSEDISNLDAILIGRDYFIKHANRNNLLFDEERPLSLRMK